MKLRRRIQQDRPLLGVELRPPRRDLTGPSAMESWIDLYQSVRKIARADSVLFLTDSAVGAGEEESLTHLINNLGDDAARQRIVPFLTLKHTLDYCLRFADRTYRAGFPGLVVLGGDRHDGIARCLEHGWQLRERLRKEIPGLLLGGWANPHRNPTEQAQFLADHEEGADFVLLQVASHHDRERVARFLEEVDRLGVRLPLIAGVFAYRSGNPRTLETLSNFIPVPKDRIREEFARGANASQIAASTVKGLYELGLRRFYVCNLKPRRALSRLDRIANLAGLSQPSQVQPADPWAG